MSELGHTLLARTLQQQAGHAPHGCRLCGGAGGCAGTGSCPYGTLGATTPAPITSRFEALTRGSCPRKRRSTRPPASARARSQHRSKGVPNEAETSPHGNGAAPSCRNQPNGPSSPWRPIANLPLGPPSSEVLERFAHGLDGRRPLARQCRRQRGGQDNFAVVQLIRRAECWTKHRQHRRRTRRPSAAPNPMH